MHHGRISVRKIVEFTLRRGDIDSRSTNSQHTALEGARLHRQLQKAAGPDYQKEVSLKIETEINGDSLQIEGRADGIFSEDGKVMIDEIKTSEVQFEDLAEDQIELFFYQGMVYGYIYGQQAELTEIGVQLTYLQTTEELITRQKRIFTMPELTTFFNDLVAEYHKWLVFQGDWRKIRNQSLVAMEFPFPAYRKGQRELAVAAYKTLKQQRRLFAEAPTGTGKTISTMFPALKALGEDEADRIFYLTAKTITRQVAEDALTALAKQGAQAKSVTLTAKDKICFLTERNCTPEHCPYAAGYYNRINEGLWDLLHHESQLTREVIEEYARKHTLCPFELSLDVSLWCDVIIGDYNYLFDPTVYLRRFFEENDEEYFFLVDEAHNLLSRSREMYSASLGQRSGQELKKLLGKKDQTLKRRLTKIDQEFAAIRQTAEEAGWRYHHQQAPAETLLKRLVSLQEKLKEWLAANPDDPAQETALDYFFTVNHFLKISEFYDEHYETTIELTYRDLIIKQFCIDPAPFLAQTLDKGKSSLLFSASFTPLDFYQEVLGGGADALRYRLPSPFAAEHQRVIIADYIATTYQKRAGSLAQVVGAIKQMVAAQEGNYFVFFPSYQYLDDVAARFQAEYPEIKTLIQDTQMNEAEREAFLARFQAEPSESLVGFCVLGGIFSEGIDLKGTRLIGTAVVGVGLPQMNHEQELIRQYYDQAKQAGFAYAYQLPGMNKVLQAAGRVIRDTTDRGVVLLLDERFANKTYQGLFPAHWSQAKRVHNVAQLDETLHEFWGQT